MSSGARQRGAVTMSTSYYLRAAFAATAMWIALLGAMSLGDNRPSLVDRSDATRTAMKHRAGTAMAMPMVKASTAP